MAKRVPASHASASGRKRIPGTAAEPEAPRTEGVKVRATRVGYYDEKRRREGDVFMIAGDRYEEDVLDKDASGKEYVRFHEGDLVFFSSTWMELVDPRTPEHTTGSAEALRRAQGTIRGTGSDASNPLGAD